MSSSFGNKTNDTWQIHKEGASAYSFLVILNLFQDLTSEQGVIPVDYLNSE